MISQYYKGYFTTNHAIKFISNYHIYPTAAAIKCS